MKGLLLLQRDEMAGVQTTQPQMLQPQFAQPQMVMQQPVAPQLAPTAPPLAAPLAPTRGGGEVMAAAPALPQLMLAEPVAPVAATMPSFMGSGVAQVSLASQCNKISLMTNTNGGYVTAATMTDASFALGEQFCLARTYAMATSEELAAKVAGFTPAQIAEQCAGFGPVLADNVAALSLKPRDEVLAGVQRFIAGSGMAPAQLAGTAKICLGVGYTTDAMDVAVASALLLTALGEKGYGELLGHHLSQGFGATKQPDLALEWYQMGIDAMDAGGAIFAPGLGERPALIRKAAYTAAGRAGELAPLVPAALPQFALIPEAAAPVAAAPEAVLPESSVPAAFVPVAVEPAPAPAPLPAVPAALPVAEPVAPAPVLVEAPAAVAPAATTPAAAPTVVANQAATDPGVAPSAAGARVVMSAARLPFLLLGQ
jgi:Tfp pilus assembly protein PilZ